MVDRPWWAASTSATSRARSWTTRGAVSVAAAVAILVLAGTAALRGAPGTERFTRDGVTMTAPSVEALVLGCGPVREVTEPTSVVGWVDTEAALAYQTPVPAAGWFYPDLPGEGDLTARPENVLRAMWSGARALWVSPQEGPQALAAAKAFVADNPDLGLDVYVWPQEFMPLPRTYAVALWGITQECQELDRGAVAALVEKAPAAPGIPGQEPPAAFGTEEDAS